MIAPLVLATFELSSLIAPGISLAGGAVLLWITQVAQRTTREISVSKETYEGDNRRTEDYRRKTDENIAQLEERSVARFEENKTRLDRVENNLRTGIHEIRNAVAHSAVSQAKEMGVIQGQLAVLISDRRKAEGE